jgi:predicted Zn finger-like uncharacterized protein
MPNTIHCPSCNRELRVPDDLLGKKVKCPACSTTFTAAVVPPEATAPSSGPQEGFQEAAQPQEPRQAPRGGEYEDEGYDEDFDRRQRSSRTRERVKGRVMAPAICLLVAAILGLLLDGFQIVYALGPAPALPPPKPGEPEWLREFQKGTHGPQAVGMGVFGVAYCGVIIFASIMMLNMRMWGLALAGSIMSMINCMNLCCLLGLPFGIWSLVVLLNEEVKAGFR